jgi:hypothetical protein
VVTVGGGHPRPALALVAPASDQRNSSGSVLVFPQATVPRGIGKTAFDRFTELAQGAQTTTSHEFPGRRQALSWDAEQQRLTAGGWGPNQAPFDCVLTVLCYSRR